MYCFRRAGHPSHQQLGGIESGIYCFPRLGNVRETSRWRKETGKHQSQVTGRPPIPKKKDSSKEHKKEDRQNKRKGERKEEERKKGMGEGNSCRFRSTVFRVSDRGPFAARGSQHGGPEAGGSGPGLRAFVIRSRFGIRSRWKRLWRKGNKSVCG